MISPQFDPLTGALSRAALFPTLEATLHAAQLTGEETALLVLDLDHFKSINDAFGHPRGDAILRELVERIQGAIRTGDLLFRYGGDEFVLLLPGTEHTQAALLAERLLSVVQSRPFAGDPPLSLTLSIGLATSPAGADSPETLFARADQNLLAAKRQGRARLAEAQGAEEAPSTRWLEREAVQLGLQHFLRTLPKHHRGLLRSLGPSGAGHTRFLEEVQRQAQLLGYRTFWLTGRRAYATHPYGALLDGAGLELTEAVIQRGSAALRALEGAVLWLVDRPAELDAASRKVIAELLADPQGPVMGVAVVESGIEWPVPPLVEELPLPALSLESARILLRSRLRWEGPEAFVQWLWQASGGWPGPLLARLEQAERSGVLRMGSKGYSLSPDFARRLEEAEPLPLPAPALPTPKHSLIGRDRELLELKQLLGERRLVTLLAPGGMGKTHLAMQAALEVAHLYRDGAYFVALAGLDRAQDLPSRLVQEFGLKATGDPQESLVQHFTGRQVLWVLDNFEHLLEAGEFLRALLQALPGLTLLVTSRERLGLSEEWVLPLEGLALEGEGGHSAALRLLLQAIRRVNPGLHLSQSELEAARRICRVVEGLPLGLELAAAWAKVLSLGEIAQEIETNLGFLASPEGDEARPERHRSLQAVFESSWRLLHPEEQHILARLSVFRGGFDREGAARVAGASVSGLLGLVNLSLVQRDPHHEGRYLMHELLRQFALERLSPEALEHSLAAHAEYFWGLAQRAEPALQGPEQSRWVRRMKLEFDNLRLAFSTLRNLGRATQGQQMATWLSHFYAWHGFYRETAHWHQVFLEMPGPVPPAVQARTQQSLALQLKNLGLWAQSMALLEQSLQTSRALHDPWLLAEALHMKGLLLRESGEFAQALAAFEEALALRQEIGDRYGESTTLNDIGIVHGLQGQDRAARAYFLRSLEVKRQIGDEKGVAYALGNLAVVSESSEEALRWLYESLAIKRRLGDQQGIANAYTNIAGRLLQGGRPLEAWPLLMESLFLFRQMGQVASLALALASCAQALLALQQPALALQIAASVQRWDQQAPTKLPPQTRRNLEAYIQQAREALGTDEQIPASSLEQAYQLAMDVQLA
ncbi:diguanylate cyclase domain-containing protein [Meiothermus ruber]|uniref:diguanylate cyclase domain-containing protein n=1 Tax=Meiothermus ruber TaxID=277 RepID=UPI000344ADB4|nr:diguanylate cyclase [Meiothermus ruber]GAO74717.1 diguanylate cyclase and serine/threonine protein kinase with TPR repeats [Meiothermus ruber H328]